MPSLHMFDKKVCIFKIKGADLKTVHVVFPFRCAKHIFSEVIFRLICYALDHS